LEYVAPGSDFIRLRSSRASSSKCVVVLDRTHKHRDKGKKKVVEDKENDEDGNGEKKEEDVDDYRKNCLLTNGVLPLLRQTDRLALESVGKSPYLEARRKADDQFPRTSSPNLSTRKSSYFHLVLVLS